MSDDISASWFRKIVIERLGPLLEPLGFDVAYAEDYAIRFEKPGTFAEVTYDPQRAGELDVWVGRVDAPEPPFELGDVVRATDCPPETVDRPRCLRAREALRSARSADADRQARTAPYVADADRAWERKDYRTVHALLEPIRNDLDATHRRRLDFSALRL